MRPWLLALGAAAAAAAVVVSLWPTRARRVAARARQIVAAFEAKDPAGVLLDTTETFRFAGPPPIGAGDARAAAALLTRFFEVTGVVSVDERSQLVDAAVLEVRLEVDVRAATLGGPQRRGVEARLVFVEADDPPRTDVLRLAEAELRLLQR